MKGTSVAVIIGDTGSVTKDLKKKFQAIPGKHSIDSQQKTVILRTSRNAESIEV